MKFKLHSNYQPRGDQPAAIDQLYGGVEAGEKHQVLLGVTGSGKTFTMAKLIEQADRPALLRKLVDIQYDRSEDLRRGTFRVRGDMIEIYPTYEDQGYRIEMWGDQIDALRQIDPLTGEVRAGQEDLSRVPIYPKTHYVMPQDQRDRAIVSIQEELEWWKKELEKQGKFVESQRVSQRTLFDIEMMRTIGYCHGIENYSRHLSGRLPGEAPPTLLDYVPQDYLMFIDESHQTVPQVRGMFR